ncbi:MAG: hypothetical protein ISR58_20530 [Anaerolineales bacterium]|nr:hypothetical protein [Chloroflexota bacterium]MBL6983575.1 hypothetical protein [Anaerolineales bacterium]
MSQSLNLKTAERNSFKLATYTDGLNDISLGIVMIVLSLYSFTRNLLGPVLNAVAILIVVLIAVGSLSFIKSRLVPPRVGIVKFGSQTKTRLIKAVSATAILVLAVLATWYISASDIIFQEPTWERLPRWVTDFDVDIFFTLLTIALFSSIAYSFSVLRFHLYGLLFGFGMLLSTILSVYRGIEFQYPMAFSGLVILGIGIYILFQFMKSYPRHSEEG